MATRVYPQDENRKREFTVKKIVLFLMVFGFSMRVIAIDNGPVFEDPVMQSKYEQLISEIRCLVCQNQSIKDSNVFLAVDLRNEIRRLLESDRSESDIKKFLVDRYGDFVLYRPPLNEKTFLIWFSPLLLLLAGSIIVIKIIRKRMNLQFDDSDEASS
jgi:cytochrome c-type biogenesis protein CcmH